MTGRMKRAQQRAEGEAAAAARMGVLVGLDAPPETPDQPVGWMVPVTGSVVGAQHVCVHCLPFRPSTFVPVYAPMLAARRKCRQCQQPLEAVAAPTCVECGQRWITPTQRDCSCDAPGVRR